jgi:hypothetical protein
MYQLRTSWRASSGPLASAPESELNCRSRNRGAYAIETSRRNRSGAATAAIGAVSAPPVVPDQHRTLVAPERLVQPDGVPSERAELITAVARKIGRRITARVWGDHVPTARSRPRTCRPGATSKSFSVMSNVPYRGSL